MNRTIPNYTLDSTKTGNKKNIFSVLEKNFKNYQIFNSFDEYFNAFEFKFSLTDFEDNESLYLFLFKRKSSFICRTIYTSFENFVQFIKQFNLELLYTIDNRNYLYISMVDIEKHIFISCRVSVEEYDPYSEECSRNFYVEVRYDLNKPSSYELAKKITEFANEYNEPNDHGNAVYVFEQELNNLSLKPHNIQGLELDIDKHYNDDFKKVDAKIRSWLEDDSTINKRLVLLHGKPGSGKTNYIKNILKMRTSLRKIYIPPYYVRALSDPSFFTFIKNYQGSLLIIEDAEKILMSREQNDEGVMSVLLNLTDGILSEILNFKVICTFNTDEENIDEALKRKGRLHMMYEFTELDKEKTRLLYKEEYGDKEPPKERMTLGEIYNPEDNGEKEEEDRRIGFGV